MPRAMTRVYLPDGRYKTIVVESDQTVRELTPLVAEKFQATSTENFSNYVLFESLDNEKVINELSLSAIPYDITTQWKPESNNRLIFKSRNQSVLVHDTGFVPPPTTTVLPDAPKQNPPPSYNTPAQNPTPAPMPTRKLPTGAQPLFSPSANPTSNNTIRKRSPSDANAGPTQSYQPVNTPSGNAAELQERLNKMRAAEQERKQQDVVQKQSITVWCNYHLKSSGAEIADIVTDFADGVNFALLIQALTKQTIKINQNPRSYQEKVENIRGAFSILESMGAKPRGCVPEDFVNGNEKAITGLLLLLVGKFKDVSKRASSRFSTILTSQGAAVSSAPSRPPPQRPPRPPGQQTLGRPVSAANTPSSTSAPANRPTSPINNPPPATNRPTSPPPSNLPPTRPQPPVRSSLDPDAQSTSGPVKPQTMRPAPAPKTTTAPPPASTAPQQPPPGRPARPQPPPRSSLDPEANKPATMRPQSESTAPVIAPKPSTMRERPPSEATAPVPAPKTTTAPPKTPAPAPAPTLERKASTADVNTAPAPATQTQTQSSGKSPFSQPMPERKASAADVNPAPAPVKRPAPAPAKPKQTTDPQPPPAPAPTPAPAPKPKEHDEFALDELDQMMDTITSFAPPPKQPEPASSSKTPTPNTSSSMSKYPTFNEDDDLGEITVLSDSISDFSSAPPSGNLPVRKLSSAALPPVAPVVSAPSKAAPPPQQEEEQHFEDFDELESFLADLANELGVQLGEEKKNNNDLSNLHLTFGGL